MISLGSSAIINVGGDSTPFVARDTFEKINEIEGKITNCFSSELLGNKRIGFIDYTHPIEVKNSGKTLEESTYEIDHVFGLITTDSSLEFTAIFGSYYPLSVLGGTKEFSIELNGDTIDSTTFITATDNKGYMSNVYAMNNLSITMENISITNANFLHRLVKKEKMILDIRIADFVIRGQFLIESVNRSTDLSNLAVDSVTFQMYDENNFGWRLKSEVGL